MRYRYTQALHILTGEDFPSKKIVIAEFYGMQVYVDLLWPEIEGLRVNYQDESDFFFRLDKEEFFGMVTSGNFYRLPDWEE